jgi:hypothetical protein
MKRSEIPFKKDPLKRIMDKIEKLTGRKPRILDRRPHELGYEVTLQIEIPNGGEKE